MTHGPIAAPYLRTSLGPGETQDLHKATDRSGLMVLRTSVGPGQLGAMTTRQGSGEATRPSHLDRGLSALKSAFDTVKATFRESFQALRDGITGSRAWTAVGQALSGLRASGSQAPAAQNGAATQAARGAEAVVGPQTFDEKRAALQAILPAGVDVDASGVITGRIVCTHFKNPGLPETMRDRPLLDVINEQGGNVLQRITEANVESILLATDHSTRKAIPTPDRLNDILVAPQAPKDFYRCAFTIETPSETYVSRNDPEKVESTRNTTVAEKVRALTGNDEAVTVLSTIMNQQFSRHLLETWESGTGGAAIVNPLAISAGPTPFRNDDGTISLDTPKGIGGAPMHLSKLPNGDYRFSVDYEIMFTDSGRAATKTPLPGMDGAAIRGQGHIEYIVDGADAAQGKLTLTMPTPPSVTFSGRMADA